MRLIFLYVQSRHGRYFAGRVTEEGYFCLIKRMVETGIVDRALILIESPEEGIIQYAPNFECRIIKDMNAADSVLEPGDVIWCRGGWKGWHDFLARAGRAGHWLMIYAANTNRAAWPFWDFVLDDLSGMDFVDEGGRCHIDFRKPVNERIFNLLPDEDPIYDLCIGASRIWDRKGQWRAVNAMIAYEKMYGQKLTAILPGPWARGEKTARIPGLVCEHRLRVDMPGDLLREDLALAMNQSRIFLHLGAHGQGDRGPMEALRCGCHVVLGFPRYHAPWLSGVSTLLNDPDDPEMVARTIHDRLRDRPPPYVRFYDHENNAGIDRVSLARMERLFSFFRKRPVADRERPVRYLGVMP